MAKREKHGSLKFQVTEVLKKQIAFGESKYYDKINNQMTNKIYSHSTYIAYQRHSLYFTNWAKEKYQCRTLEDCKPYINEYLQERESKGLSAYTLKLDSSALVKVFKIERADLHKTPDRKRENIFRSRGVKKNDKYFNAEKHKDLVTFCRGTGLRKSEVSRIRGIDLKEKNGKYYLSVTKGTKGGKVREVEIVGEIEKIVEMLKSKNNELIFEKIPRNADIHSYRAEYCKTIYKKYARSIENLEKSEIFVCRKDRKGEKFDKEAMQIASESLGHSRIDVIAGHYLLGD